LAKSTIVKYKTQLCQMLKVPYLVLLNAAYKPVWDLQENLLSYNLNVKKENKNQAEPKPTLSALLFASTNLFIP